VQLASVFHSKIENLKYMASHVALRTSQLSQNGGANVRVSPNIAAASFSPVAHSKIDTSFLEENVTYGATNWRRRWTTMCEAHNSQGETLLWRKWDFKRNRSSSYPYWRPAEHL
jgi:hypothetical protein